MGADNGRRFDQLSLTIDQWRLGKSSGLGNSPELARWGLAMTRVSRARPAFEEFRRCA
jgi:hypothetical protein